MDERSRSNEEDALAATKVRRSITRLARRLRGLRSDHGISGSKLAILGWLFRAGTAMTATDLARLERLQPQSLTRIIAELDEESMIRRTPDEADRRQILIEITQTGRELLLVDAFRQNRWLMETMAARLTKAEREMLAIAADLLDKLAGEPVDRTRLKSPTELPDFSALGRRCLETPEEGAILHCWLLAMRVPSGDLRARADRQSGVSQRVLARPRPIALR